MTLAFDSRSFSLYRGTATWKHARPIAISSHTSQTVHNRCFSHYRGNQRVCVSNSHLLQQGNQWEHPIMALVFYCGGMIQRTHPTSGTKPATRWTTPWHIVIVPPCPHNKRFWEKTRNWHCLMEWMRLQSSRNATPRVADILIAVCNMFTWTAARNTHFQNARGWHWPKQSNQAASPPRNQPQGSI